MSDALISTSWSAGTPIPSSTANALADPNTLQASITTDSTTGATSVALTFSLPDHTFDFLAQDETLIITYNVTVTDGTTSATRPIVITVTGTNDAPMITAHGDGAVESVDASAGNLTDSGTVSFTDVDLHR